LLILAGCSTLNTSPVHIAGRVGWSAEPLYRDGKFFLGGTPGEGTLASLASRGVRRVIDLRPAEPAALRQAEEEIVVGLGMSYSSLPVESDPPTDAWVSRELRRELGRTRGPVLIHGETEDAAAGVWGRYLRVVRGFDAAGAVLRARAAGMTSPEMTRWVRSPVYDPGKTTEGFR